ncbi:methionine adenosyltransferase [Treponema socranskii subsp. socranskii VPI DR56BR1116 = ATCC 35536]|uniref:S-adenosylmethionine synthase n=1 Tax=Treponema socranskii subsp. socranskii VPI DR56BR1116 = ATCC 35536 TaxID=1125725 RepID=U1FM09_TRESO|nr:methionine adenosyltransferase [Treponema socranskii]ERF60466.1 methionine adenosyltransferase [Treponema socranskii subsp. socranskii VPI DR56BR1116 = ATCC 35536]ERJ97635.1 methionine adenosyltransferase [Treponema socranskii subsp. socranskii VPI DR56BR1116 = ATCC 35536]
MNNKRYLFTSESVSEGHPDKICDRISDAVLDACLARDAESHVACETFTTTGMVLVGGEITTEASLDIERIARDAVEKIGYTDAAYGLDCNSMAVLNVIHKQSPDINQGVVGKGLKEYTGQQGAGDQGMMFGFACSETPELMPAPVTYAHKLLLKAAELRKNKTISWLRPDAKSQVTIEYEGHVPLRIDTVVVSHQHDPSVEYGEIKETIIERIVKPVLDATGLLDKDTKYFINPTGRFVTGGPQGDSGLTGRKIIVDTYGGMGRHGGGAFSGKDPSKVDRSAAYMARYIAKNIVAAGLADRAEIELAYAIGVPFPVSIMVDTFGTEKTPVEKITKAVKEIFDCTPAGIVKTLDLKRPIYEATTAYGHFGRSEFSWEKTDKADALKSALT